MKVCGCTLRGSVVFAALAVGLMIAGSPALALQEGTFAGSFGGAGSGDGQFEGPVGVAVSEVGAAKGDVYVADQGNNRVEQFSSSGAFIAAWGWGVKDGKAEYEICTSGCQAGGEGSGEGQFDSPEAVAVDNSTNPMDPSAGDVYVTSTRDGAIEKFGPTGTYLGKLTEAGGSLFGELHGVAVDPSGDLWVYQGSREKDVDEFSDTGGFLKEFSTERNAEQGLAVDSNDDIYATCCGESVGKFSSAGTELAEFSGGGTTALALNPLTNDLFVDKGSGVEQYGPFGEPFSEPLHGPNKEPFDTAGLSESDGVAVNGDGVAVDGATEPVYMTARSVDKVDIGFATITIPTVTVAAATEPAKTTAMLNATVNPEGVEVTSCEFEYGASSSYEHKAPCSALPGDGTAGVSVSASVSALSTGTTYDYRLVAENANGHPSYSANETVTTLPAVIGVGECAVPTPGATAATLQAPLEPVGEAGEFPVEYHFEYGTSAPPSPAEPYEHTTTATEIKVVGEAGIVETEIPSGGAPALLPNQTYDCRLAARDGYGTTGGPNGEFKTLAVPAKVNQPPPPEPVTEITRKTAVLHGIIDPENSSTTYHFRYGPTTSYGLETPEASAGSGYGEESVESGRIEGLRAGTTYHFALVGSHAPSEGGAVTGPDYTFTTAPPLLPTVAAAEVGEVTRTGAVITDTIDPEGLPTTYEVDLGTDATYSGARIFGQVVAGEETIAVSLEDLAPGTTYFVKTSATDEYGTTEGSGVTFTTPGVTSPIDQPLAPPLLATPQIAFPAEEPAKAVKPSSKKSSKKKSGKPKKHRHAKARREHPAKGRGRGRRGKK